AVSAQLPLGATYGSGHMLEAEGAEKVLDRIPGTERVLWSNTGSEATQVALRLARGATGRRRFVKFGGHYHGWSDTMLIGYRPGADGSMGLGSQGQTPRAPDDVTLLEWGDLDAVAHVLRSPSEDIAAVFCEAVLADSGVEAPPAGFLAVAAGLCAATGARLVFVSVLPGCRSVPGVAVTRHGGVLARITLAAALAGGFTPAADAGRAGMLELAIRGVAQAGI